MNHNILNLSLAIGLSIAIMFGWQHFYEKPRLIKTASEHKLREVASKEHQVTQALIKENSATVTPSEKRIRIKSQALQGSINLIGFRFDDLVLLKYKQTLDPSSAEVELLAPTGTENSYFAEVGWFSSANSTDLPNNLTEWNSDSDELTPDNAVNLSWDNNSGVRFLIKIELDSDYMFTITQTTINKGANPISIQNYGLINRNYVEKEKTINILHQGLIGSIDGKLEECTYEDAKDKKIQKFTNTIVDWVGITDKYWLTAFIPDKQTTYSSNLNFALKNGFEKFQIDFITKQEQLATGSELKLVHRLFAGAKKVDLLDRYSKEYNITLFDRAIDFGWFYILTKPVFNALNFSYHYVGNFGVSILIVTVIIKLLLFSLANKSYRSMKKIKKLQPEIERIKALYGDDKARLNKEIMELYKREKANPLSGCLPLLIQIPVFFSIYKVLYVTIEMRHAPFFGWIKDLSAPDPTSLFNLFGLLPYSVPSFLQIGAWAIIMAVTMFLQQRMSPEPTDPTQALMMKLMPLIFLVMFSGFPAGLLIYWSWNNILSIIQQYSINKLDTDKL